MARKSKLADHEFAKQVAELYLAGLSREEIAKGLTEVNDGQTPHVDTISLWTQDPRVQVFISAGAKARVHRITRRIDKELEGRIIGEHINKIDTETLLRIRKELLGKIPQSAEESDAAMPDLWDVMDSNPEVAEALAAALEPPPKG